MHSVNGGPGVTHRTQRECRTHTIEAVGRHWQSRGIGSNNFDFTIQTLATLSRSRNHAGTRVNSDNSASWADGVGKAVEVRTGPAADIENGITRIQRESCDGTVPEFTRSTQKERYDEGSIHSVVFAPPIVHSLAVSEGTTVKGPLANSVDHVRSTPLSLRALIATMIVDSDINTAPIAGERRIPIGARTPAARGNANTL
jgi:hypothetical protein